MTDYRAQHDADALLRTLDARIDQKIAAALKVPTGITPGTAYGSVIFDAQGRATWGGAGGSSGAAICYRKSGAQSIDGAGTPTRIDYDVDVYDSQDPTGSVTYPGGLWTYTAPLDGWYRVDASCDYSRTSTWADGDLCVLQVVWTSGTQPLEWRRDMRADTGLFITSRLSGFYYIDLSAGDTARIETYQTSGTTNPLSTAIGMNVIIQWVAAL